MKGIGRFNPEQNVTVPPFQSLEIESLPFPFAPHPECFCHQIRWQAASSGNGFASNPRPQIHPIRSKWLQPQRRYRLHTLSLPHLPTSYFLHLSAFPESQVCINFFFGYLGIVNHHLSTLIEQVVCYINGRRLSGIVGVFFKCPT